MEPENIFDPPPYFSFGYRGQIPVSYEIAESLSDPSRKKLETLMRDPTEDTAKAEKEYAQNYSTGAVRDVTPDKLRYDLIDVGWLIALEDENRQDEQYDDDGNLTVSHYSGLDNVLECLHMALSKNDPSGLLRATNMIVADYLEYNSIDTDTEGAAFGMPCPILTNLAKHLTETSKHYGYDNWRKGIPLSSYHQSFLRHYVSWLNSETDEDHYSACLFNLCGLWYTMTAITWGKLPEELNDINLKQFESLTWVGIC